MYYKKLVFNEHKNDKVLSKNIFNVVGPERMSRFEFIKRFSNPRTKPCSIKDFGLAADRPPNSSLSPSKDLFDRLGTVSPTLDEVLDSIGGLL